jgi:hypothetical protein
LPNLGLAPSSVGSQVFYLVAEHADMVDQPSVQSQLDRRMRYDDDSANELRGGHSPAFYRPGHSRDEQSV